ncbi:hypothetical protein G6F31_007977 [Rhizopus arrhizus]|nr:hypothetical protein G6F31_007977 [Rhizopus arrhizus]
MEQHIVKNTEHLPILSDTNRWLLDGVDISVKFHEYRRNCLENIGNQKYTLDEHFNQLLSISGVIVLQRRCFFQSLPSNLFPPELLLNMRRYMMNKFYHGDHFDSQQLVAVKNILSDYINDTIDDDCARMQLLGLCKSLNEAEKSVIRAIVDLIPSIHDCTLNDLSEAHLSASFVHPMMQGLFPPKIQ